MFMSVQTDGMLYLLVINAGPIPLSNVMTQ